ncbi:hypothetical protein WJX84_008016 [Apatococcus fuscideae]|uniref:Phosphoglycerate mutase-like protein n=1 Tax=Apatococcus fuscideae TaxID=2026836 RepID=A0AAW1T009_9CHLO
MPYAPVEASDDKNKQSDEGWMAPNPRLLLTPLRHTKVIHFIRHGEGYHNIGYEGLHDPHLTQLGWDQAHTLQKHLASIQPPLNIEVVFVSPLVRTLQTAAGIFGYHGESAKGPTSNGKELMHPVTAAKLERTEHPAVQAPKDLPMIITSKCRERMGPNLCDRRQDLSAAQEQFPAYDWSLVKDEEGESDEIYDFIHDQPQSNGCYPMGESEGATKERGKRFVKFLMQRPEQRIAVVSHCGFLRHTLRTYASEFGTHAQDELLRDFNNCEMRSMVLSDFEGSTLHDSTWFEGGKDCCNDEKMGSQRETQ